MSYCTEVGAEGVLPKQEIQPWSAVKFLISAGVLYSTYRFIRSNRTFANMPWQRAVSLRFL